MTNKMLVAAWCGVAMFVVYFFSSLLNSILGFGGWSYAFVILSSIAWIGFVYGFVSLGDKYKNGLVKGFAIYFIVLAVIVMILSIITIPYLQGLVSYIEKLGDIGEEIEALGDQYGGEENIPKEELEALTSKFTDFGLKMMKWFLIFYVLFFVLCGIPYIFFGIGLLKLSKDVELSKAAGIMNIVGGAATIIFIGAFLIFAAFILEIIILFKEGGKKIKRR